MGDVDVDVEVRPSVIQGLGVFAAQPFAAGARIRRVHVVREVTPDAPLRPELGERPEHCNYANGKVVLYGLPDRHYNHSCDPTAYEAYDGQWPYIVARRPIAAGDEITVDYLLNNSGGDSWPCHCGSPRCIGMTAAVGFFGLPVDRQLEYLPELAEWFVAMHRERIEALRRQMSGRRTDTQT